MTKELRRRLSASEISQDALQYLDQAIAGRRAASRDFRYQQERDPSKALKKSNDFHETHVLILESIRRVLCHHQPSARPTPKPEAEAPRDDPDKEQSKPISGYLALSDHGANLSSRSPTTSPN